MVCVYVLPEGISERGPWVLKERYDALNVLTELGQGNYQNVILCGDLHAWVGNGIAKFVRWEEDGDEDVLEIPRKLALTETNPRGR